MSTGYSAPTPPSRAVLSQMQSDIVEFTRNTLNMSTIEHLVPDDRKETYETALEAFEGALTKAMQAHAIAWDGDRRSPLIFDHTEAKHFDPSKARTADAALRNAYKGFAAELLHTFQAETFYYSSTNREIESAVTLKAMVRLAQQMATSLNVAIDPIRDSGLMLKQEGQKFLATLPPEYRGQGGGMSGAGGSL